MRLVSTNRGHLIDFLLSVCSVVLLVLGFVLLGVCGGGISFVLFGLAVGVMGGVVAHMGGLVILTASLLIVVTLVWAGLLFASQSGCSF